MTVTLVAGPPAAGKSTWVTEHAGPDDLVVDLDVIAGGHHRDADTTHAAWEEVQRLEAGAANHPGDVWVIRTAPDPTERLELAERLGANRVVVIATPAAEAKARAATAGRPGHWPRLIDSWWRRYAPAPCDDTQPMGETMTDTQGPEQGDPTTPEQGDDTTPAKGTTDTTDWQSEAQRWKEAARRADNRAKTNARAAAELEKVQRESMSDAERAIAEAADKARHDAYQEARNQFGHRMVLAELRAAAAGRIPTSSLEAWANRLDLTGFLTDDGDVDAKAIQSFIEDVAPEPIEEPPRGFPDLGQGARGGHQIGIGDTDPMLRDLKAKLGIR